MLLHIFIFDKLSWRSPTIVFEVEFGSERFNAM